MKDTKTGVSDLALWKGYCDKKMQCEKLTEENSQLKADNTELVDYIESELMDSANSVFKPHIAGVFAVIREKLIQKHKDSNDG